MQANPEKLTTIFFVDKSFQQIHTQISKTEVKTAHFFYQRGIFYYELFSTSLAFFALALSQNILMD